MLAYTAGNYTVAPVFYFSMTTTVIRVDMTV